MKKVYFCFVVLFAGLFLSCSMGNLSYSVNVVNDTGVDISVTQTSLHASVDFPVLVSNGGTATFFVYGPSESVTIYVTVKETTYSVKTGYMQDASMMSFTFTLEDGELAVNLVAGKKQVLCDIVKIKE